MYKFLQSFLLLLLIFLVGCISSNPNNVTHDERIEKSFEKHPETETANKLKSVVVSASEDFQISETQKDVEFMGALVKKCNAAKANKLSSCSKGELYCDTVADAVIRNCFSKAGFKMIAKKNGYELERIDGGE